MERPEDNSIKNTIDLKLVRRWLREAGKIALTRRDTLNAVSKKDGSLVTDIDHQIESFLCEQITKHYPGHRILAEEGCSQSINSEYLWTIDPIDGTRAYASGLPIWGPSIGILKNGEPYAGLFFMPVIGELYLGLDDKAFLNDKLIPHAHLTEAQSSLAFLAVPSNAHRYFEISFHRIRSLGSTTAHLIYVARGTALAALTRRVYIWDIAPVLPIMKATGIILQYVSGRRFDVQPLLDGSPAPEPLIAAPGSVIDEIRAMVRSKLQE
jgi:fructose-1,6-bisphosphatase/inositol monophosphatase family enzyme